MGKEKETALDIEFNLLLGQIKKIKGSTSQLNQELANLSKKIVSCSKRGEVSEEYRKTAEKAITRHIEKTNSILNVIGKN